MAEINTARLLDSLSRTVGPAPWYWKTFPQLKAAGQRLQWTHHGEQGALGYLVSLAAENDPENPLLALNTYCRAFAVPTGRVGMWCPEGRNLRVTCFDPDELKPFDIAEIAGWFKQSSERIYAGTAPVADFDIPLSLGEGTHKLEVPKELEHLEELIMPASYAAKTADEPAFALYVLYPHAGLVEVLPQKWFTAAQYEVGRQWIPRAARDPESHRIFGECFGVGSFLLEEDGVRLERWLERKN